ncbi:hypothetical protein PT974_06268 [Cladobotryum mycophilum]|uniref:Uncharacterized protein n=1 Tax=Cladobotryum mycophilum TaxID=491253 RepID=A0ABR0SL07_9HYPO
MASPTKSQPDAEHPDYDDREDDQDDTARLEFEKNHIPPTRTPEPHVDQQNGGNSTTPSTPGLLGPFDWDDFESRYERALQEADEHEREILKEAEGLSKYFQAWASSASAHDDERAVKRLQTRQRYVNISEEKMAQKQQHYEEVVRAFESALALLRST